MDVLGSILIFLFLEQSIHVVRFIHAGIWVTHHLAQQTEQSSPWLAHNAHGLPDQSTEVVVESPMCLTIMRP